MGRQAVHDGIEWVCATPHIRHDHDVRIEEVAGRVEALNERLRAEGVPVTVLQGGEVAETAVEDLGEEELGRVALGERPLDPARAGAGPAERQPPDGASPTSPSAVTAR